MKISTLIRALAVVAVLGCTSEESIGPDGAIDFQGTWGGTIGDPNLIQRTGVTWTTTHQRSEVTGPIVFQLSPGVTASGTLTGSVEGSAIEFTIRIPPGGFPAPVPESCSLEGTGFSTTATATDIVATMALNWTAQCIGAVTTVGAASHRLTLVKID